MTALFRRLSYLRGRRQMDADLAQELEFHRALLARGGPPQAQFGNVTLAREDARAVWI